MLDEVLYRKTARNISIRELARQLEVSPSLLSETLNGKRRVSRILSVKFRRWLKTAIFHGGHHHSNTIYRQFMAERESFASNETTRYYREKPEPFTLWCEHRKLADAIRITRREIGEFLTSIRKNRRGRPLSNGAIKLHHQTLKTLFNYVGETCGISGAWANPVNQIKVKQGDAQRTAYSDDEISATHEAVGSQAGRVLRLRNRAIITVLLNSALRASELLSLRVGDFDSTGGLSVIGKGGKRRSVTKGESGVKAVQA